jgi:hypothetical protein
VGSPPPLAVAVLFPVVAAEVTRTFKVKTVLEPTVSVPVKVQLRLLVPVQLQLAPLALDNVIPNGRLSVTMMLPLVLAVPLLVIVIV